MGILNYISGVKEKHLSKVNSVLKLMNKIDALMSVFADRSDDRYREELSNCFTSLFNDSFDNVKQNLYVFSDILSKTTDYNDDRDVLEYVDAYSIFILDSLEKELKSILSEMKKESKTNKPNILAGVSGRVGDFLGKRNNMTGNNSIKSSDNSIEVLYAGQLSYKKCTKCNNWDRCKFVSVNGKKPKYICRSCLKNLGSGGWHQSKEGVNRALEMADYEKLYDIDDDNKKNQSDKKQRIKRYLPILGLELLGMGILIILAGLSPDIGVGKAKVVNGYMAAAAVLIVIEIIHMLFPEGERLSSMAKKGSALKSKLGDGYGAAGNKLRNTASKGKGMFSGLTNRFKKDNDMETTDEDIDDNVTSDVVPVDELRQWNDNARVAKEDAFMRSKAVDIMGDIPENATNMKCVICRAPMWKKKNQPDMVKCHKCGKVEFISRPVNL